MTQSCFSQKHMNKYNMHMEFIIHRRFRGKTGPQPCAHHSSNMADTEDGGSMCQHLGTEVNWCIK